MLGQLGSYLTLSISKFCVRVVAGLKVLDVFEIVENTLHLLNVIRLKREYCSLSELLLDNNIGTN